MPVRDISQERQDELASIPLEPHTKNHWNNPEWDGQTTFVRGTGKYRFNQYGTDGFAWTQYRFNNKNDAILFLCSYPNTLCWVNQTNPQYEVRVRNPAVM